MKEHDDKILKSILEVKEAIENVSDSAAETKERQVKAEKELRDEIAGVKDQLITANAVIEDLAEDKKAEEKSVFDVVMKGGALKGWGYHDPVTRALYKSHAHWKPGQGWTHDGKAYGVDPDVMLMNDMLYLLGNHLSINSEKNFGEHRDYRRCVQGLETYKLFRYELERSSELRKALNTSTDGEGQDFVPTGFSASLIDDVRLALKVAGLFPTITMPARSGAFENPIRGARQSAYLIGEPTSDSASKIPAVTAPTDKVSFSAKTHGVRMLWSYDIDEDSAIAIMPFARQELVQALADGEETSIVNGDTSTTHQDSDVTAANDVRKSFLGLRYHAGGSSGNAAVDISTLSLDNLRAIRRNMGRFGVNPRELAYITSISSYIQLLTVDEVLTMDKIGNLGTVMQGQLGSIDGIPIVVSEFMREDLNTSGVYDGSTTTDTILLLANTRSFYKAYKPGGVKVETGSDIETQQKIAVASRRLDFKQVITPGASGEETVGLGYSLTS